MTTKDRDKPDLMPPSEVAALMRVDPKTVTRWAATGKLASIRTPGGHRRFFAADVYWLLGNVDVPNVAECLRDSCDKPATARGLCAKDYREQLDRERAERTDGR